MQLPGLRRPSGPTPDEARVRFERQFGPKRPVVLSIVPATTEGDAVRDVGRARSGGVDGVFLVNRRIGHQQLLRIAGELAKAYSDWFVGVNCRDLRPQDVFCRLPEGVSGAWTEPPQSASDCSAVAAALQECRQRRKWKGLYFCGPPYRQDLEPAPTRFGTLDSDYWGIIHEEAELRRAGVAFSTAPGCADVLLFDPSTTRTRGTARPDSPAVECGLLLS